MSFRLIGIRNKLKFALHPMSMKNPADNDSSYTGLMDMYILHSPAADIFIRLTG